MLTIGWTRRQQKKFSLAVTEEIRQNSRHSIELQSEKRRHFSVQFLSVVLISLTNNFLVKSIAEIVLNMTKVFKFWVASITFTTLATSTIYSKPSDAVRVTHFFQRLRTKTPFIYLQSTHQTHIIKEHFRAERDTLWKTRRLQLLILRWAKTVRELRMFGFQSICVQGDTHKETETTKRVERLVPISVSVSSRLIQDPLFVFQ